MEPRRSNLHTEDVPILLSGEEYVLNGVNVKSCRHDGSINQVFLFLYVENTTQKATRKRSICTHDECTNKARGRSSHKHGARETTCSHKDCTNNAKNGGVCIKHGTKKKTRSHKEQ